MISYVRGELAALEGDKAIVEVGGVGLGIYMPGRAMGLLPGAGREVKIHTYLHVKEDAMKLFGFLTRDDLEVFRLLIGVNGIGPKVGLGILSALSSDELRFAVMSGDVKAISSAPGIGKKTAEKLILELKDKLNIEDASDYAASQKDISVPASGEVRSEAVQALAALGYGGTEALKAVRKVEITEDMKVEEVLKKALKLISS